MSETIERLRNAVGMLRDADGAYLDDDGEYASVESAERQYVAALAAVEQEMVAKDAEIAPLTAESRKGVPSMSENMRRLRQAIDAISFASEASTLTSIQATDAALAAVEQELAALRLSYENASRAHFEATKRIGALTEYQAALEAERDELRKRPTLEEVVDVVLEDCECDCGCQGLEAPLRALYAEKADR